MPFLFHVASPLIFEFIIIPWNFEIIIWSELKSIPKYLTVLATFIRLLVFIREIEEAWNLWYFLFDS